MIRYHDDEQTSHPTLFLQQPVHVMGAPPSKTYAAAGAGVSSPAQPPPPAHNYLTPPPFIPHVHGYCKNFVLLYVIHFFIYLIGM